jgi:carbamoyltransferase
VDAPSPLGGVLAIAGPASRRKMNRYYVGLATSFHDPAVAVVDPYGEVVFAEASERYLQDKRALGCAADVRETVRRIINDYCDPGAEYVIAKPWSRTARQALELLSILGLASHERLPRRRSGPISRFLVDRRTLFGSVWQQHTANQLSGGHLADVLLKMGNDRVSFVSFPHHLTHAATGCLTSPFEEAACMVVDGQGERGSISYFGYRQGRLRLIKRMRGAESLGLLYAFCTNLCGFSPERDEYWKVMGLAPYGKLNPEIHSAFVSLVRITGLTFRYPQTRRIREWAGRMQRWARPSGVDPMAAADLAFTTQYFFAQVMTSLLDNFHALGVSDNLVLAGGCALNSSYNGQIVRRTRFRQLHVPSAPADDGNALGAALLAFQRDHPDEKPGRSVQSAYLGSTISKRSLEGLAGFGRIPGMRHLPETLADEAARLLADGKLLGWIQGRAEFGPRALGNRSILADPRREDIKATINSIVKLREDFRPFAPSILDELGPEYFEDYQYSPYMERVLAVRGNARARVPGVVHVDGTARVHSVRRHSNRRFYDLIRAFHDHTGIPLLLNTSLNVMGKPIVHSLEDALGFFYTTGLDALAVEDYLIQK